MVKLRTPIPEHVWEKASNIVKKGPWYMAIYRLVILAIVGALLTAFIVAGPGFFAAFVITTLVAALWMDDAKKTIMDVWQANFHEVEV
jgi:hypothetical protein